VGAEVAEVQVRRQVALGAGGRLAALVGVAGQAGADEARERGLGGGDPAAVVDRADLVIDRQAIEAGAGEPRGVGGRPAAQDRRGDGGVARARRQLGQRRRGRHRQVRAEQLLPVPAERGGGGEGAAVNGERQQAGAVDLLEARVEARRRGDHARLEEAGLQVGDDHRGALGQRGEQAAPGARGGLDVRM
jgi:hypothetical protein